TRPGWAANSRYSTVFLPPAPTAQRMPDSAPRACSRTSLMVRDHRGLDAENAGQEGGKAIPMLAVVAAGEQVAAGGAEVHPAGGQVVHIHGLAQHAHVGMGLRQACGQGLPAVAAVGGAENPHAPLRHGPHVVAGDRQDIDDVGVGRFGDDGIAEVAGQPGGDFHPVQAAVVATVHAVVTLAVEPIRLPGVDHQAVDVVAAFDEPLRLVLGPDVAVDGIPAGAAVITAVGAAGRHGGVHPLRQPFALVDGMDGEAAFGRLPGGAGRVVVKARHGLPALAAVAADEQASGINAGINRVRFAGESWRQIPDRTQAFLVLPDLVLGGGAEGLPGLAGILAAINVGAPDQVAHRGIGRLWPARVYPGVQDLVSLDQRSVDAPLLAAVVADQAEQPLFGADQQNHAAVAVVSHVGS